MKPINNKLIIEEIIKRAYIAGIQSHQRKMRDLLGIDETIDKEIAKVEEISSLKQDVRSLENSK